MPFTKLPNYLRTHRKRNGFSQDDVAFLLGHLGGAHVCRWERHTRQPTLATAFALEVIFRVPARELFAGVYQKVEQQVASRARFLERKVASKPDRMTARKLEALRALMRAAGVTPLEK